MSDNIYIKRHKQLIDYLYINTDWIKGDELAQKLQVSSRTIRNDVGYINAIEENLIESSSKGYRILSDAATHSSLTENLRTILDPAERRSYIFKQMLLNDKPLNLHDIADKLFVSIQTVSNDFRRLQKKMNGDDICLVRKGDTIFVNLAEHKRRLLLANIMKEEMGDFFHDLSSYHNDTLNLKLSEISNLLREIFIAEEFTIDDYSLNSVTLHLAMAIFRVKTENFIDGSVYDHSSLDGLNEFILSQKIANQICEKYEIDIPEIEISGIAYHLLGRLKANHSELSFEDISKSFDSDVITLGQKLLVAAEEVCGFNLYNENMFIGFISHLQDMLIRLRNNRKIQNPMSKNFKNTYPVIYDIAVFISDIISESTGFHVNEEEITSLAIHIGSALEHSRMSDIDDGKVRALLVSPQYSSRSDKICHAINNRVGNDITWIGVHSTAKKDYSTIPVDVIITTANLSSSSFKENQRVVYVNPFLKPDDFNRIEQAVLLTRKSYRQNEFLKSANLWLREDLFFIDPPCKNETQTIQFLCDNIINFGFAPASFKKQVLKREQISSTSYGGGFSIPHSVEMDAEQTAVSVIIFNKEISWGDDKVSFVVLPAISKTDNKQFLLFHEMLTELLFNTQILKKASTADTFKDLIDKLRESLEST